ncbi:IclR family transcriptional regulator [Frondihabitans sp. PAMC 28766]|uniref:IclR family transcriptional regulator n=1 Tax=Frondihabitans sp. PAMC 28766 TaxID=1795630 RepID=UPI00078E2393|nr:IclR family transcriptional regulator [Frondihabitans sp. PAMC 28766]AMM22140.1 IclR family transcriptional regulator [Frondihabitans sp. PAMC 28766]
MAAVPAARNVLRVIRYLAEQARPTHAAAVARELGLPRSTAYQLLGALLDEGFVVHFPEESTYALSTALGQLGTSADRATRLRRLGAPLLTRLLGEVRLPVVAQLGILHGQEIVYLAQESAPRAPSLVSAIGVHLPAHLTATGRVILAHLDHAQVRALYPDRESLVIKAGSGAGAGPGTLRELDELLRDTRRRGWGLENGEITDGYASVSAVVLDHNDYATAAIGVTYRTVAVDQSVLPEIAAAVGAAAGALGARLRGR